MEVKAKVSALSAFLCIFQGSDLRFSVWIGTTLFPISTHDYYLSWKLPIYALFTNILYDRNIWPRMWTFEFIIFLCLCDSVWYLLSALFLTITSFIIKKSVWLCVHFMSVAVKINWSIIGEFLMYIIYIYICWYVAQVSYDLIKLLFYI